MDENHNHDPNTEHELTQEKELAFIAALNKITTLSELLGQYEPVNPDKFWETCSGISAILSDIAAACYVYKETVVMLLPETGPGACGKNDPKE
ncbi:hypothetical protein K7I13_03610 [Brucepastera parasyntrophica]|uniref:hypothetical protein n=1 Tax=Brucepastera parasyntrophica TaxID=2880008 RepID=UPI00210B13BB|nr:hypothetical protein [Brucepastera parasyntrophica]ULQ60407.1 hypothetical protein K7I13_03610 [Brucepastera parasyntrophica]